MSTQQTELNRILEIIGKITKMSAGNDYIYRGEPECYPKVSSNLYRELEEANLLHLDIGDVQKAELEDAKGYIKKTDEFEILTAIQHFGGKTNLLDFTSDFRVALFFACDRFPFEDGRVILQGKNGTIKDWIREPKNSVQGSRSDVQDSVFVQPPEGFIEPDEQIIISKELKQPILKYLEDTFCISTERIYPDLQGFVSRQKTRMVTYKELSKGMDCQENGNQENDSVKKNRYYKEAIKHFTNATQQMPGVALAYKGRSAVYHLKGDFDKALDDAVKSVDLDPLDAKAHCALYRLYLDKGDFENATTSINEAIRLKPDQPEFYSSLGDIYFIKRDFENAIKAYNKAIQLNSNFPNTYFYRGLAYILQRDWTKAKTNLIRARNLDMDIIVEFSNFATIEKLEQEIGIQLPEDITAMLTSS